MRIQNAGTEVVEAKAGTVSKRYDSNLYSSFFGFGMEMLSPSN